MATIKWRGRSSLLSALFIWARALEPRLIHKRGRKPLVFLLSGASPAKTFKRELTIIMLQIPFNAEDLYLAYWAALGVTGPTPFANISPAEHAAWAAVMDLIVERASAPRVTVEVGVENPTDPTRITDATGNTLEIIPVVSTNLRWSDLNKSWADQSASERVVRPTND